LAREPFNVVLDTIHVDRSALADAIREIAQQEKIRIVADQVLDVQHASGQRVLWVTTRQGQQLRARWFVDASGGRSRLFARAFDLPAHDYGPSKVAMWDYFPTSAPVIAGTTLYGSASSSTYMDWIWQIPIQPDLMSVGCVATGETMKALRQTGLSVQQIYEARLREFPDLVPLLQHEEPISPRVTSFRCRVHEKVRGPNWLIVGEAASMVDPMTSNGVTAALRHASEAAILIANSRNASRLPRLDSAAYAWRVRDMASFFNSLIERIMYETPIRARFGALAAGDCYTIPAWLMNLFYSRTRPNGIVGSLCFGTVLRFLRCSAAALSWFCRGTRPKSGSGQLSAG
jgi:flavin-dependent dehydrogenase